MYSILQYRVLYSIPGAVFMSDLPSTGLAPGIEHFDITIEACRFSGFAALHGDPWWSMGHGDEGLYQGALTT